MEGHNKLKASTKKDSAKARIKRLSKIVEDFLEKDFSTEELIADPERIDELRQLLEENLWCGSLDPHDPDWSFSIEVNDPDNPDEQIAVEENIKEGATTLLNFHDSLRRGFWSAFRKRILDSLNNTAAPTNEGIPDEYAGLSDYGYLDTGDHTIEVDLSGSQTVHISLGDKIVFFHSGFDAVRLLMDLIQGQPKDIFKVCPDCGRIYIKTSDHKRMFCSQLCASRFLQRKKRGNNPEAFKEYHKVYYHKTLKTKRRAPGSKQ